MKVYLDNCCYNRPYDDQTQIRIHLETEAKLHIQDVIKNGELDLVTSYILEYENGKNRFSHKRQAIADFMSINESYYVGAERDEEVKKIAGDIIKTGVKSLDAFHVACAILAGSDYFITTDDRLLKYQTEDIQIVTPGEFIRRLEVVDLMNNAVEIMDTGFACLVERLGIVDAERFVTMIKRDSFDYTIWRREYFDKMDLEQISTEAVAYAQSHPHKGKGKTVS